MKRYKNIRGVLGLLAHAHDALTTASFFIAALCVAGLTVAYIGEVIARYTLSHPTSWSRDLASYLLALATFLAIPELARTNAHIRITGVGATTAKWVRRAHSAIIDCISAAACAAAGWASAAAAFRASRDGVMTQAALSIPKAFLLAVLAYGLASAALYFLRRFGGSGDGAT